eukprot:scaffold5233_cov127-Isochrysis_galbana.AAC.4
MAPDFRLTIPGRTRRVIQVVDSTLSLSSASTSSSSSSWNHCEKSYETPTLLKSTPTSSSAKDASSAERRSWEAWRQAGAAMSRGGKGHDTRQEMRAATTRIPARRRADVFAKGGSAHLAEVAEVDGLGLDLNIGACVLQLRRDRI